MRRITTNLLSGIPWKMLLLRLPDRDQLYRCLKCYLRAVDEDSLKEDKRSASTVFPTCIHDPYNRIGYCYEMGLGIERNIEEAFRWYRIDAERGDNEEATKPFPDAMNRKSG